MSNIEDGPGFETFGEDVKAARIAKRLSRKALAEIILFEAVAREIQKTGLAKLSSTGFNEMQICCKKDQRRGIEIIIRTI